MDASRIQGRAVSAAITGGRLMSPVAFAERNLANGKVITQLIRTRGAKDLLKDQLALARYKVGELPGAQPRGGPRLIDSVYLVPVSGPDDRLRDHVIVRQSYVLPNDAIGTRFVDVGIYGPPNPRV